MMKAARIVLLLTCYLLSGFAFEVKSSDRAETSKIGNVSGRTIPESLFQEAFSGYINSRLEKENIEIIISKFTVTGNKTLPAGEVSLKLFQKEREEQLSGHVRLIAIVSIDNIPITEVTLSGWIDVFDSVVCASRRLSKGEVITKDDVYLAKRNISRLHPNILTGMDQAIGLMLKHDVKENDCLKDGMLQKATIVKRGDMVTILAELGGIRVTAPGKILEKGCLGEYIRVQNAVSKKNINARVINDSTVMVDF
ncbi:MAG: flagellar basal body P-ring formation chaperone FlgA [Desulfobacterales bacterium]|nr:flagellar basal body P-ring formation chaperone FlgA [Desulfobacterales bacterium]